MKPDEIPAEWPEDARQVFTAYYHAMLAVGQLARCVGRAELPESYRGAVAAKDMRAIRRIAQEITGMDFEEYT